MKRAGKWFSVACNHYGLQPRLAGMGQHLNAPQGSQGIFPCFLPKGYQRLARQETHLGQWLGKWLRGNPWKSWKTSGSLRSFSPNPLEDLDRFGQTDRIWQINLDLDLVWRIDAVAFKRRNRTHKFRLELPWVAYVTTKSPIGTARPSRVVAAEPVFVYCLPLPIRKENNLTNPCQILLPIHRFGMFWAFQCSLKDCRECIEAELLCHLWEEIPEIFLESHSWGVPIFHCPFHHSP